MTWLRLSVPILLSGILTLPSCGLFQQDHYPWIHYFERPDMPNIHCAFADKEGNVILSTGDWSDTTYTPPYIVYRYWSEGLYRISCDTIQPIECPAKTFVLDGAVDSEGTTWLLIAEGVNGYVDAAGLAHCADAESLDTTVGYRGFGLYIRNYRFARLEGATIMEDEELTEAVPTNPVAMCSDRRGRIYIFSWRWSETRDMDERRSFVSWWADGDPSDLHVCEISNIFSGANMDPYAGRYPEFGPDGLAYFPVGNAWDFPASTEYAVLCLDPERESWDLYCDQNSPFLDSAIRHVYVDPMNVKWFGTEEGLVRFDGESWTRYTTRNSALPFNTTQKIVLDDIDQRYYVVSQGLLGSKYCTAMSYLDINGEFSAHSDYFSPLTYFKLGHPRLFHSAREVWWYRPPESYTVYSYDHESVMSWNSEQWLDTTYPLVGYVGSTAAGRTFCVTRTCVMIW